SGSLRDPGPARPVHSQPLGSVPGSRRYLASPGSVSCARFGAGLAASGSPPPGLCKYLFPPRGPSARPPPSLPPSHSGSGALPRFGNSNPGRGGRKRGPCCCCSLARLPALRGPPRLFRAPGRPPSAPAPCPTGGGAQIPVSGGGGGGDSQFSLRRSTKRTLWLSPLPFPALNPSPGHRESVPVEFTLHLAIVSSVLGPVKVTTLEEEAAAAALASSPPVRCPRSRRGGAAATAAPPLPLPSGRAGSSCDALGLHLIAQRGPRPGIAQVPVLARFSEVTPITEFS
ncbi:PREDICTED: zinc finger protein ZIC 5-like, partial [Rhinopithecus bieti]|uniref:zinc finger protein ZIC 5-like n=1 Tax=Rhinopithecus bieti TaxID=61621 RepID=UPI00083C5E46